MSTTFTPCRSWLVVAARVEALGCLTRASAMRALSAPNDAGTRETIQGSKPGVVSQSLSRSIFDMSSVTSGGVIGVLYEHPLWFEHFSRN